MLTILPYRQIVLESPLPPTELLSHIALLGGGAFTLGAFHAEAGIARRALERIAQPASAVHAPPVSHPG